MPRLYISILYTRHQALGKQARFKTSNRLAKASKRGEALRKSFLLEHLVLQHSRIKGMPKSLRAAIPLWAAIPLFLGVKGSSSPTFFCVHLYPSRHTLPGADTIHCIRQQLRDLHCEDTIMRLSLLRIIPTRPTRPSITLERTVRITNTSSDPFD